MHRFLGLSATALSIFWFANSAAAAGEAADTSCKAPLEARYQDMKRAMAAHDAVAIQGILAPGFVSIDALGGRVDAGQMLIQVMALKPDPHKTSSSTVLSCSGSEKGLIVKQRFDMKTTRKDPDGSPHQIQLVSLSTDTWVKPGKVWLIQRTVTDDMTQYRDGKLIAHRTHPDL